MISIYREDIVPVIISISSPAVAPSPGPEKKAPENEKEQDE
jgi:hypothetical protein